MDHVPHCRLQTFSACQQLEVVDAKIAKELAAGRLAGPFQSPPRSSP